MLAYLAVEMPTFSVTNLALLLFFTDLTFQPSKNISAATESGMDPTQVRQVRAVCVCLCVALS